MKVEITESEIERTAELLKKAKHLESMLAEHRDFTLLVTAYGVSGVADRKAEAGRLVHADWRGEPAHAENEVRELAIEMAKRFLKDAAAIYRKHMPVPVEKPEGKK